MAITSSSLDDLRRWQHLNAASVTTLPLDRLYGELHTSSDGLTSSEATIRVQVLGPGGFATQRRLRSTLSLLAIVVRPLLLPLWIGAIIAFAIDRTGTGQILIVAAALNTIVAAVQERKSERATAALHDTLPTFARVLRDGQEQHILATMLVPGDLLLLRPNDIVPADARVIDADNLHTANAVLHSDGTSTRKVADTMLGDDAAAGDLPNLVYAGSRVIGGHGRAIVYATGLRTAFGQIAALTQRAHEEPSPLLRAVARLGSVVLTVGLIGAIGGFWYTTAHLGFTTEQGLAIAILFLSASVPVGLMPGITLTLIEGARRLQQRQAIFRRLSNVETLGATTVICADKTGTLTQNEMTVRELWTADGVIQIGGVGYQPRGEFSADGRVLNADQVHQQAGDLLRAAVLTSTARLLPPDTMRPYWHIVGDAVEAAQIAAAEKAAIKAADLHERVPQLAVLSATRSTPLNAVIVQNADGFVAYFTGAPGDILARCTAIATRSGERPLIERDRALIARAQQQYSGEAMRVIAFARRSIDQTGLRTAETDTTARDLTLLGMLAVVDPPRQEVASAIDTMHCAKIRTIMLTSDDTIGATSLARRCTMVRGAQSRVISGPELARMDDATLRDNLRTGDLVLARLTPEHKVRVVEALEALGEVVLVTGGEASDVPALKAAYTGIAMGANGSPAAAQAADVILLDDNFATIADAIAEGRAVEQRVRRLVALNLAITVVKLAALIVALITGLPLLLTVGQQLLIDFLAGLLPGLAIGAGRPDPRLMRRAPRSTGRPLMARKVYVLGYTWFGGLSALLASAITLIYFRSTDNADGSAAEHLLTTFLPYDERIADQIGQTGLIATSLYVVVSIAALLGATLIRRSAAPGDRRPVALLVGLVGLSFALLVGMIAFDGLHHYVALTYIPTWGWLMALSAMLLTAVCERVRQRLDPIYKPSEIGNVPRRISGTPSINNG